MLVKREPIEKKNSSAFCRASGIFGPNAGATWRQETSERKSAVAATHRPDDVRDAERRFSTAEQFRIFTRESSAPEGGEGRDDECEMGSRNCLWRLHCKRLHIWTVRYRSANNPGT